jgi:tetratricopeptide (TPR) repeat protein
VSTGRASIIRTIEELERAVCDSDSPRDFAPLAEAYRIAGRLDDALRTAERGTESFPTHVGIGVVHARILTDLNDFDRARDAYRRVLELDPENAEALSLAGPVDEAPILAAGGEQESAVGRGPAASLAEELAELDDLFPAPVGTDCENGESEEPVGIATLTLAEIYSRQGLRDEAVRVCESILERQPDNEEARRALDDYLRRATCVSDR